MKEVVIKISDAMYKYITMEHSLCIKEVGEYLFGLVRCTGILLPEGHGRLIDENKIHFSDYEGLPCISEREIAFVPTVIEADKENKQE